MGRARRPRADVSVEAERPSGYLQKSGARPDPDNIFEMVSSRGEWERRQKEGTLHPDGKITVIRASKKQFQESGEDRASQWLPSRNAPAPGTKLDQVDKKFIT